MNANSTQLIEQFAIETQEHLDAIEPILLQAEWSAPDKPAIAALFRAFHSIKGLARLLELHGLESLANHAESLLSEVRAERQALNAAILALLLEALDGIRLLREQGIVNGTDGVAPPELIAALDAATRASAGGGTAPVAAPPPVVEAALHDDPDTLVYFAELLDELLPNLAVLAGGTGDADQAAEDLDVLMLAAERLHLNGLHTRLAALAGSPSIDCLAAVIADACRFGTLIGQPVGADQVRAAAAVPLRRAAAETAASLANTMAGDPVAALPMAERLVLFAAAGVEDGGIAVLVLPCLGDAAVLEPALAAVRLLAARAGADGPDLLSMAAERLRDAVMAGRTLPPPVRKVLEDRGIDPELLGELGATAIGQLTTILEGGQRKLAAVTLSLPPKADRLGFLRRLGRQMRPAAVQATMQTGIETVVLLVVTSHSIAALRAEVLASYPDTVFVEVHHIDGQAFDHPWAPPRTAAAGGGGVTDNQVRVPVEILDRLFGRIGEFFGISSALNVLMVDSQVPAVLHRLADHLMLEAPELLPAIDILQRQQSDLSQIEAEVHRLVSLVHEATLGLRVIPLDIVFNRFPRMIREMAKAHGKLVRFEARADGIKVDKGMTELLADPLMHMLRNAIDHGIEPADERVALNKPRVASIRLSAVQSGNRITVEIADDGRGIDGERVRRRAVAQGLVTEQESHKLSKDQIYRFIFAPGFSTAEQVTETSGRGVGMDVALINISRLGGRIDIHTIPHQGTTFRLDMPLSAAMQTVLLAETSVQTVAFPERMVVEAATVSRSAVQYVNGQRAILMHDRFLPLFHLADLLCLPEEPGDAAGEDLSVVVVASKRFRYGVEVRRILRRHEMLIRETHPRIAQLPGIGGVSTLGSDRIVLVVDQEGLTDLARGAIVPGMRSAGRAAE